MRTRNEQYAYLSLHGDIDPAEITSQIGLSPTEAWRKGERNPIGGHERIFSRWTLRSRLSDEMPLEDHIRDVLDQMSKRKEAFKMAAAKHTGTMQLVDYFWLDFPGLHFEQDIVEALAHYRLAVDFDFYGLYSHRREDTGFTYEK